MRIACWVGIALVAGCGRVGFDAIGDGGGDGAGDGARVFGWGWELKVPKLGAGDTTAPVELRGLGDVVDVTVSETSCAVRADGTAVCWGESGTDDGGTARGDGGGEVAPALITQVSNVDDFIAVRTTRKLGCGVRRSGEIWCWGSDVTLALGDGGGAMSSSVPVRAGTDADFVEVGTGGGEVNEPWACGRRATGEVKCWGSDIYGVLGNGETSTSQASPMAIVGPTDCQALAVGDTNACVLDGGGAAWCWGRNDHGQLGTGDMNDRDTPTEVATTVRFTQISTYKDNTCGLTATGEVWCWGGNTHGELTDASLAPVPMPTQMMWAPPAQQVSIGELDLYVLALDGTVWSAGAWNSGALGRPSNNDDDSMLTPIGGLPPVARIAGQVTLGALVVAQP